MLPDYHGAKARFHQDCVQYLEKRIRLNLGPFSFPEYHIFEGHRSTTEMENGTLLATAPQEMAGRASIHIDEIRSGDPQKLTEKLNEIALQIARQQHKMILETMRKTCDETGQTIDCAGEKFSPKTILKALDRIWVDFDESGQMNTQTVVVPPQIAASIPDMIETLKTDKDLQLEYEALVEKKRMQWREREAARKLVG